MNGLTLEQVWVIIVWSLKALESGRHPEEDWYGMSIFDGPFFALRLTSRRRFFRLCLAIPFRR